MFNALLCKLNDIFVMFLVVYCRQWAFCAAFILSLSLFLSPSSFLIFILSFFIRLLYSNAFNVFYFLNHIFLQTNLFLPTPTPQKLQDVVVHPLVEWNNPVKWNMIIFLWVGKKSDTPKLHYLFIWNGRDFQEFL